MRDIYEAAERLSAVLSFNIGRIASNKGWASKPYSFMVAPTADRTMMIVSTSVALPYYKSCAFVPRREPESGGRTWWVDIRRTDGVLRETWSNGLTMLKYDGKFMIMQGPLALSDDLLDQLLDDLGTP